METIPFRREGQDPSGWATSLLQAAHHVKGHRPDHGRETQEDVVGGGEDGAPGERARAVPWGRGPSPGLGAGDVPAGEGLASGDKDDEGCWVVMEDPPQLGGGRLADEEGRDGHPWAGLLLLAHHGDQGLRADIVDHGGLEPGFLGVPDLGEEGAAVPPDEGHEGGGGVAGPRRGLDGVAGVGWPGFHEGAQQALVAEGGPDPSGQGIEILADAVVAVHCPDQGLVGASVEEEGQQQQLDQRRQRRSCSREGQG